jgi:tetratricopeptide (TPR) repeat protein
VHTPDNLSEARKLFERALALDASNVDAIVGAALTHSASAGHHLSDQRDAEMEAAETLALKALSIAPENARAHLCLGVVRMFTNRAAQGIPELERALAIDRNLAAACAYIGLAQTFIGRGEETTSHIEDALRLSPHDTAVYLWRTFSGTVKVFLAKNEEAVGELRRAIEANRNFAAAHFYNAVALAELGRLDEARLEVKEGLSIDPMFTIRRYRGDAPSDNPVFLSRRKQLYEVMRHIGIPEGQARRRQEPDPTATSQKQRASRVLAAPLEHAAPRKFVTVCADRERAMMETRNSRRFSSPMPSATVGSSRWGPA